MDIRDIGFRTLFAIIKEKDKCVSFENYIYEHVKKLKESEQRDMYMWFLYQTAGFLIMDVENLKNTLKDVKKGKLGWNSVTYKKFALDLEEHDDYIVKPFEIVDGVVECPKCHGAKTWSVQRQVRAADEPMTTFSRCVGCGHNWKYSG